MYINFEHQNEQSNVYPMICPFMYRMEDPDDSRVDKYPVKHVPAPQGPATVTPQPAPKAVQQPVPQPAPKANPQPVPQMVPQQPQSVTIQPVMEPTTLKLNIQPSVLPQNMNLNIQPTMHPQNMELNVQPKMDNNSMELNIEPKIGQVVVAPIQLELKIVPVMEPIKMNLQPVVEPVKLPLIVQPVMQPVQLPMVPPPQPMPSNPEPNYEHDKCKKKMKPDEMYHEKKEHQRMPYNMAYPMCPYAYNAMSQEMVNYMDMQQPEMSFSNTQFAESDIDNN